MEEPDKPWVLLFCRLLGPCMEALSLPYRVLKPWESPLPLHQFLQSVAESVSAAITRGPRSVDAALIRSLPALKFLFTTSAGLDHIDLDECKRREIAVAYAGTLFSEDAADYAVGLFLDALRRISAADRGFGFCLGKIWEVDSLCAMEETDKPSVLLFSRFFVPSTEALSLKYRILKPWESPLPFDQFLESEAQSARAAIVSGLFSVDAALIRSLPALQFLFTTSAGLEHVDLDACKRRGIAVAYAGTLYSEDVADCAVGLLIDVLRRISAADRYVRQGLWAMQGDFPLGSKLGGKHVGIIGLGSIGLEVAKRLEAFGCIISYNSRKQKPLLPYQFFANVCDLAAKCDALIVCCAYNTETYHLINEDVLLSLGAKGVIINVGRGKLVDEKALVNCLAQGKIGGAGLDVFENEPDVPQELYNLDNVVLSPHRAVLTEESRSGMRELMLSNLDAFFANKPLIPGLTVFKRRLINSVHVLTRWEKKPETRSPHWPMKETDKPSVLVFSPFLAPSTETLSLHYRILKPWESPLPFDQFLRSEAQAVRAGIVSGLFSVDAALIRSLPALQFLFTASAGVEHVDLRECKRRGIAVAYAGPLFSEDAADYAVGLLIDVLRRISAADRYVRQGLWTVRGDYPLGSKLWGKHIGIIGVGSIGLRVAKRLEAFGCIISYNSRQQKPSLPYPFFPNVCDLADKCEALIVCCAFNSETYHLINEDVLLSLGPEGVIINVGRGKLVDEKALVNCLTQGKIGGAGLDVFENEPDVPQELYNLDNVVLSPHRAVHTEESRLGMHKLMLSNVEAFFANKPLISPVPI
ncbi:hypothetical protein H6P81_017465 [Aristolochia fimbriata]|uniref:Uncharacterized protein n=1 Tax=Aristolochia fimbriata TaxID=158543 RepID=A0AAV7E151_ARIFI|nr:hypothetical protein H6P81_017465 [Aristolochia fimbriata]